MTFQGVIILILCKYSYSKVFKVSFKIQLQRNTKNIAKSTFNTSVCFQKSVEIFMSFI